MKKAKVKKAAAKKKIVKKQIMPVPEGYHTVTPYLTVRDAAQAIDFYKRALGAKERSRMPGPDGKSIMHAELKIGDSIVMLSDELPGMSTAHAPTTLGGTTGLLFLYVPNVDATFKRAMDAGCKVLSPLADMFWGDRYGKLEDPFGNQWMLATHKEDVTPKEMNRRAQVFMAQMSEQK
jgi:PhnB protein